MNSRAPLSNNEYSHTLLGADPRSPTAECAAAPSPPLPDPRVTAIAIAEAKVAAAVAELAAAKAAARAVGLELADEAQAGTSGPYIAGEAQTGGLGFSGGPGFTGEINLSGVNIPSDDQEDREQQSTTVHFAPIPNPPEQEYESFATAEKELISFSRRHGFELAKCGNLYKGPAGTILRRPFRCSKGNQDHSARYRAQRDAAGLPRQRNKPSKLTGCPFTVTINAVEKNNSESPYRIALGRNPTHNHPGVNPIHLANHRRANRMKIREFLRNARDSQIEPRKICAMAQREFHARYSNVEEGEMVAPVLRDIYNEWANIRRNTSRCDGS